MCLPSNKAHLYGTTLEKKCSKKTKISNYLVSSAHYYPHFVPLVMALKPQRLSFGIFHAF